MPRRWPEEIGGWLPKLCTLQLTQGCYRITFEPAVGSAAYRGTMRVDRDDGLTISGDLYRFSTFPWVWDPRKGFIANRWAVAKKWSPRSRGRWEEFIAPRPIRPGIPIYPRDKYYSYLKVVDADLPALFTRGACSASLTIEEYVYNQPAAGSFNGSFPATPTRTLTAVLSPQTPPSGYSGPHLVGKLYDGSAELGSFTMSWVSQYFRRATLEVDTLTGAVAPLPVPAASGTGTEDFRTTFATAGWDLGVVYDQTGVAVPAGVDANECWSNADLHGLMTSVRKATTNLDQEWRLHLLVVPAKMNCGRGIMYDQIGAHREGVVSYSDDGYPASQSSNWGTAEGEKQRDVPRAFLRSAAHEVGHGFNMQHQNLTGLGEPGSENSIMTVSPAVADTLGGPTTGTPGVFPDDIDLSFNEHTRHHLVHFPDPAVRPGAMAWSAGHSSAVPEADADTMFFDAEHLSLRLESEGRRVKLGEPLRVSWELENRSETPIHVPSDVGLAAQHAKISVTDPAGSRREMRSFVVQTDALATLALGPGESRRGESAVFWSSSGFTFERPGRHTVELRVQWGYEGVACGVRSAVDVWVDFPSSDEDNHVASLLMNEEVGKFVALGGGARHLEEAVSRIGVALEEHPDHAACRCLRHFAES